jgi:putative (di)nucleoside polyphosphate hydrolase
MADFDALPYRKCAGLTVLNPAGLVLIGRRLDGPEHVDELHAW